MTSIPNSACLSYEEFQPQSLNRNHYLQSKAYSHQANQSSNYSKNFHVQSKLPNSQYKSIKLKNQQILYFSQNQSKEIQKISKNDQNHLNMNKFQLQTFQLPQFNQFSLCLNCKKFKQFHQLECISPYTPKIIPILANQPYLKQTPATPQIISPNLKQTKSSERFLSQIKSKLAFKIEDSAIQFQNQFQLSNAKSRQHSWQFQTYLNENTPKIQKRQRKSTGSYHHKQQRLTVKVSTNQSLRREQIKKNLFLIDQYQQQNKIISQENQSLQKQIQYKIIKQRILMEKINILMDQINKKNNQTKICSQKATPSKTYLGSISFNQNFYHQPRKLQLANSKSRQKVFTPVNKYKKQKSTYNHSLNQKENLLLDQNTKNFAIDTILEYSLLDDSTHSVLPSNQKSKKQQNLLLDSKENSASPEYKTRNTIQKSLDFSKSPNHLIDLSISEFSSRFVPRLSNEQKLKELEELFEKQLKKCLSQQKAFNQQKIVAKKKSLLQNRNLKRNL